MPKGLCWTGYLGAATLCVALALTLTHLQLHGGDLNVLLLPPLLPGGCSPPHLVSAIPSQQRGHVITPTSHQWLGGLKGRKHFTNFN